MKKLFVCLFLILKGGVIQKMVEPPFLIDGHRFSIRIYAAVTQLNPIRVYLSSSFFLVLIAMGNPNDINEESGFISNFHYQQEFNHLHAGNLAQYLLSRGKLNRWVEYSLPLMGRGLKEFFANEGMYEGDSGGRYFELLGCDVILDSSLTPHFLECNRCATSFVVSGREQTISLEELLYIVLYESETDGEIPQNLHYWQPF